MIDKQTDKLYKLIAIPKKTLDKHMKMLQQNQIIFNGLTIIRIKVTC